MRGRKKQPARLKIANGNPGKRKIQDEPQPKQGSPVCPEWFGDDARAEWERVVPELERLKLLTVIDGAAIEGHCLNYARALDCERTLAKEGVTFATEHGPKKRPEATIAKECWGMVRAFLSELGLSPAARARLGAVEETGGDDFDEFLKKHA